LRLLDKINFAPPADRLWLVGDIVNRGPDSLAALRWAHKNRDALSAVLGNHDLHLLMVKEGFARQHGGDTLSDILRAPDADELCAWLRRRPLLCRDSDYLMVHAGLLPQWTPDKAAALAREAEAAINSAGYRDFFAELYGNEPSRWEDDLSGVPRLRAIVNAMTRLRICSPSGEMNFAHRGNPAEIPEGYIPWFDAPARKSKNTTIVYGHWSALGLLMRKNLIAIDTGCLWGRRLTAVRLEDRKVFQVDCAKGG
jgi:bis(5'-nucleosyl)-tetraphosphatase (symmetrical)